MPNSDTDISSSGKVAAQNIRVSDKFTDFAELPSKGHCRLMKAQRYGIWNVLKGLKPEYTADKQFVQMLTKEYTLMIGLNHPNIVRTYGHENVPELGECIIMEYVDGRTLADFVRENPSAAQCRQVAEELLAALAYCHKKQIVHQDLKPSNILITHDGDHVKIIDFGLSDSHEWAILKEPAFTKAYAAPEQLAGEEVDNRTDIYAFGIILRQLFPKRYGHVIRKCLQPQREKRYSSAETVLNDIKRTDSRRKWIPIVAIVFVILIGLAIFIGRQFVQKEEPAVMIPETPAVEHNDKDSLPAENLATKDFKQQTKPNVVEKPVAQESVATNSDDELLNHYLANIKSELDSIQKPFNEEIKSGAIVYKEIFLVRKGVTSYKILVHIEQRRQQLSREKQKIFMQYIADSWYDMVNNYDEYDSDGRDIYKSYESLHSEGKISDAEYDKLTKEYGTEESELFRLAELYRIEGRKNH
ncbi:MAG: serine/threonine protein kinase [Bacteroidales bacterium]|nr:serine/threonine protein kinase [Bacteroidales bacterium]